MGAEVLGRHQTRLTAPHIQRLKADQPIARKHPRLSIDATDLTDPAAAWRLWGRVLDQRAGELCNTTRDRLRFFALVEHAKRVGNNPPALLASNLFHRRFNVISQADEDAARAFLRRIRDEVAGYE